MSATSTLSSLLAVLAEEIRGRILQDRALRLADPFEETHTQNLISRLAAMSNSVGLTIVAREVPKTVESQLLGADVAFWVMGDSGVAALHLQCKRLYPDDTYRDLGHENTHGRQVDLLIKGAKKVGAGASYMFYNGLTDDQPGGSNCCILDFSSNRNGVSLAAASAIEPYVGIPGKALPRETVEHLCTPLVCIARCCRLAPRNEEDDLAAVLRSWYERVDGDDLSTVDVSGVPPYARPLFDDLAEALDRIPWPYDDQADPEVEDPFRGQRQEPDPHRDEDNGTAIAVVVAQRPR